MVCSGKVGFKHQANTHSITAIRSRVDWRAERVLKLELVSFNRYDSEDWKLLK